MTIGLDSVSNVYNAYSGVRRGGVTGNLSAGIAGTKLASSTGAFGESTSGVNKGVGIAGDVLGIYQGIEKGGVMGDTSAAVNAAKLGSATGAFGSYSGAIGNAAGYVAAPLAVYNAVENWRSGDTGNDALQGAEAGAAIGSVIPVVGTVVGAVIGGIIGAASSAFGGGKNDPETQNWDQYASIYNQNPKALQGLSSSQNYQMLAGIFDARGSSIPFYGQYGRMGEMKFLQDMTSQINQAVQAGIIKPGEDAQTIYNTVVNPWITAMGGQQGWQDTSTVKGAPEKAAIGNLLTNMIQEYTTGNANWVGVDGSTVNVNPYAGTPGAAPAGPAAGQPAWANNQARAPDTPVAAHVGRQMRRGVSLAGIDQIGAGGG